MTRHKDRGRFDIVEVALLVVLAVLTGLALGQVSPTLTFAEAAIQQEREHLRSTYGPAKYSEGIEEWIIRDFFRDRREGIFVDIGANHYRDASTTFFLEHSLGWSGIAVDPQAAFETDYRKHRPRTRFFPFFVSDTSDETVRVYLNDSSKVASARADFTGLFGKNVSEMEARTISLSNLLDQVEISRIDFLSVDVELAEPNVLRGFDIDRFQPDFVCIEAHSAVRQQILDYFTAHEYVVVGSYLRVDVQNLYFKRLSLQ